MTQYLFVKNFCLVMVQWLCRLKLRAVLEYWSARVTENSK
jgi:hypothetical protein